MIDPDALTKCSRARSPPGGARRRHPVDHGDHRTHAGQRSLPPAVGRGLDRRYDGHPREPAESLADPVATEDEIAYLIGQANRWLARPLRREDVIATYAGYRPLVAADASESTTQVSREHVIFHPAPGLVAIAGGKYTTYRVMAADAVDAAVAELDDEAIPGSTTADIPLVGAVGFAELWADRASLAERWDLPMPTIERLLRRHGSRISEVLDVMAVDPRLREPLPPEGRHLGRGCRRGNASGCPRP